MTAVHMTAEIVDGNRFETICYPDDEIMLRVVEGGNVQVIEYHSTDRDGPPAHYHPWHEVEFVIEGEVEFYLNVVAIANRHGVHLESDVAPMAD